MCAKSQQRLAKWRSSVRRLEPHPVFKEVCELELKDEEEEVEIHVWIKKSEYLSQQNEIGLVRLAHDTGHYGLGESQLMEAFARPNTTVTAWHPVFPPPPPASQLAPEGSQQGSLHRSRSRSPSPSRHSRRSKLLKPIMFGGMQL